MPDESSRTEATADQNVDDTALLIPCVSIAYSYVLEAQP